MLFDPMKINITLKRTFNQFFPDTIIVSKTLPSFPFLNKNLFNSQSLSSLQSFSNHSANYLFFFFLSFSTAASLTVPSTQAKVVSDRSRSKFERQLFDILADILSLQFSKSSKNSMHKRCSNHVQNSDALLIPYSQVDVVARR